MTYYAFEEQGASQPKQPFNKSAEGSESANAPSAPAQETTTFQPTYEQQWHGTRHFD